VGTYTVADPLRLDEEIKRASFTERQSVNLRKDHYLSMLMTLPEVLRNQLADLPIVNASVTIKGALLEDLRLFKRRAMYHTPADEPAKIRTLLADLCHLYA
jgi:hypothetical protein